MRLALFDLDNTLLQGDSDLLWGELLARSGAMDVERTRQYHVQYHEGTLDIDEFLRFQLEPLAREPRARLERWRSEFIATLVRPRLSFAARALVERHRDQGHELAIVTATNRFITEPIARELDIPNLLATEPEEVAGRFTGHVAGVPCYRAGKIERVAEWLASRGLARTDIVESWFYSDSHNDLPLLGVVDHPVAVDPCPRLRAHAHQSGWPVISLRDESDQLATGA